MKFVMSYSCGKDSTLALHKMIEQGHEPVGLLVMINEKEERSYFHGADREMLDRYAAALAIPLIPCPSRGDDYHLAFEDGLARARAMGAEAACFGDIDIEQHREWDEARCAAAGLRGVYPLWQCDRRENVFELLRLGYRCLIKSLNNRLLPKSLLGQILSDEAVAVMSECGIDVCGENGEYHTLVVDGPIFKKPLTYRTGEILDFGEYSLITVD